MHDPVIRELIAIDMLHSHRLILMGARRLPSKSVPFLPMVATKPSRTMAAL